MNDQNRTTITTQLLRLFDLSTIAGESPTRVALVADDKIVCLFRDTILKYTAGVFNDTGNLVTFHSA